MRPLSKATLPLEHRAGDKEYNNDTHVPPAADEYYYSSSDGDDDDDGNTGVGPENVVGAEKKKNAKGTKKAKRLLNKKLGRAPTEAEVAKKVRALQKKAAAKQQAAAVVAGHTYEELEPVAPVRFLPMPCPWRR